MNGLEQFRFAAVGQGVDCVDQRLAVCAGVGQYMQAILGAQKPHPGVVGQLGDFGNQCLLGGLDERQIPS